VTGAHQSLGTTGLEPSTEPSGDFGAHQSLRTTGLEPARNQVPFVGAVVLPDFWFSRRGEKLGEDIQPATEQPG
jgi:hypothetical protein